MTATGGHSDSMPLDELRRLKTEDYGVTVDRVRPKMMWEWTHGTDTQRSSWRDHGGPGGYVDHLRAQIKANGITEPIQIGHRPDGSATIYDGTHRALIAHEEGVDPVPVRHFQMVRGQHYGKLAVQEPPEGLTFAHREEETGGSKFPTKIHLDAVHPEHGVMGTLRYYPPKRSNGRILVDKLEVAPEHRRKGVGSALMDEMQRRHPNASIDHGDRTNDGNAWWRGYTDGRPVKRGRTSVRYGPSRQVTHDDGRPIAPDDELTLYHETSAERAEHLRQHGTGQSKPVGARTVDSDYEPGRGMGKGLYLMHSPHAAGGVFGDTVLPVRVRAGDLAVPPERAHRIPHGMTPLRSLMVGDGYTETELPHHAFGEPIRREAAVSSGGRGICPCGTQEECQGHAGQHTAGVSNLLRAAAADHEVWYHGTTAEGAEHVWRHGLAAPPSMMSPAQWYMVTSSHEQARRYSRPGGKVIEFHIPKELTDYRNEGSVLWPSKEHTAYGHRDARAAAPKGTIPPSMIHAVHDVPDPKHIGSYVESGNHRFTPDKRVFTHTDGLDHRLFDGEHLRPEVRSDVLARFTRFCAARGYREWSKWGRLVFFGSEASEWSSATLEGNGDFDLSLGVDYPTFRRCNPTYSAMTDQEIAGMFTQQMHAGLNDPQHYFTVAL